MNLFKFPYLIRKEIIKQMGYTEKFLLSLCSSRALQFIQMIGWKEIDRIQYGFIGYDCNVQIRKGDRGIGNLIEIMSFLSADSLDDTKEMEIQGVKVYYGFAASSVHVPQTNLRLAPPDGSLCVFTETPDSEVLDAIHNHILELFGTNLRYSMFISDYTVKPYLPKLRHIKQSLLVYSQPYNVKMLNDYFLVSPDQEHVNVVKTVGPMGAQSKIFNTQQLDFLSNEHMGNECLEHFKGKALFSNDTVIDNCSVINFLKKWISNDGFQDLDMLSIYMDRRFSLDPEYIKSHFLIKKFDESPVYHYEKMEPIGFSPLDFTSQFYIVRDCDGVVASVTIERGHFIMTVWNLNEQQMKDLEF